MDRREHETPSEGQVASAVSDATVTLSRAELLLASAEAAEASSSSDQQEAAWREAIRRMVQGAAAFRTEVIANAAALLDETRQERTRIDAEANALRAEANVLREEISLLRAERDLCLALAVDAGNAINRQLAQWRRLRDAAGEAAIPDSAETDDAGAGHARLTGAPASEAMRELAVLAAESIARPASLVGTKIGPGAESAAHRLALSISALPGLVPLFDLERALKQLPSVQACTMRSLRHGVAIVDLVLRPSTAPIVVAAEILSLPTGSLVVDSVAEQRISTRFALTA